MGAGIHRHPSPDRQIARETTLRDGLESASLFENDFADRAARLRAQASELGHDAHDSLERSTLRARDLLAHDGRRVLAVARRRPISLGLFTLALGLGAALLFGNTSAGHPRRN